MKPILLATDGSPSAAEATLEAIELAQKLEARLVAIAVSHPHVPTYGYYGYTDLLAELTKIEDEHVAKVLAETKEAAAAAGVECDTIAGSGPVVETIVKAARGLSACMIVIGAHGWGPMRRIVSGSVSTGVMHAAPCPLLVVRGGTELLLEQPAVAHGVAGETP